MCNHKWRMVCEEMLLIGGNTVVGYECVDCREYIDKSKLTPAGLGGTVLEKAARLVGPHGGRGNCSDGSTYKEQIIHEDGRLEIIR